MNSSEISASFARLIRLDFANGNVGRKRVSRNYVRDWSVDWPIGTPLKTKFTVYHRSNPLVTYFFSFRPFIILRGPSIAQIETKILKRFEGKGLIGKNRRDPLLPNEQGVGETKEGETTPR